mmetsp:Transcript_111782/g.315723  ORF Transcript_111782/g.315723 Transcript_111782/m.315723 type:complete len:229 (-) Transcript_111782:1395-2081(-)
MGGRLHRRTGRSRVTAIRHLLTTQPLLADTWETPTAEAMAIATPTRCTPAGGRTLSTGVPITGPILVTCTTRLGTNRRPTGRHHPMATPHRHTTATDRRGLAPMCSIAATALMARPRLLLVTDRRHRSGMGRQRHIRLPRGQMVMVCHRQHCCHQGVMALRNRRRIRAITGHRRHRSRLTATLMPRMLLALRHTPTMIGHRRPRGVKQVASRTALRASVNTWSSTARL